MKCFKNVLFLCLIFLIQLNSQAQKSILKDKLKGIANFEEIKKIVDQHYDEIASGKIKHSDEPNRKHWQRWSHYMSSRTGEDGNLINQSKYIDAALQQKRNILKNKSSTGTWSSIGPTEIIDSNVPNSGIGIGRVDRIAFHPTNENIIYIGTPAGGLFRSRDGGSTWVARSDNLPSPGISGIVVSNDDPNKIFILTGDGDSNIGGFVEDYGYMRSSAGVFVSYDQGLNWYPTGELPITNSYVGYQLIQDPNDASILLVATSEGVYRSTDFGNTWNMSLIDKTYELKFKPGESDIVYATQAGAFYKSTDGGINFNPVTISPSLGGSRVALAVTEVNPNLVYLVSGSKTDTNRYGGLYLSFNSGNDFTQLSNTPNIIDKKCDGNGSDSNSQANYDLALGVSHSNASRMVAGAVKVWGSTDTGVNFSNLSPNCGDNSNSVGYVHDDIHDIEYHPLTGEVFLCSDGGLYKSDDDGQEWESLSNGIVASQIYHMAGSNVSNIRMMMGLQDNGTRVRELNGTSWIKRTGADGYDQVYRNGSFQDGYLSINKDIYRFSNLAVNLAEITPIDSADLKEWFGRVARSNNDGDIVLVGYARIYRSTDAGENWTDTGARGNWDIESCPSNNSRFYAVGGAEATSSSGGVFYRSDDTGETWTQLIGGGAPPNNIKDTDIGVRPNFSSHVWRTRGGYSQGAKVYFSDDAGATWTNMSGSLPNIPINCISIDNLNNAYIGTDIGVYYRSISMDDWVPFFHGLPNVPVTDLVLYQSDQIIRAATFGRGVWESEMYSNCSTALAVSGTLRGNDYYEAAETINTTSTLSGAANTTVTMKAGEAVVMNPGFRASVGNFYRAYIAPCGESDIEE